jgi:hypothetical protein
MPSYSLNLHLLWSGGPPREGEQGYLRDLQRVPETAATVAATTDMDDLRTRIDVGRHRRTVGSATGTLGSDAVHFEEEARA